MGRMGKTKTKAIHWRCFRATVFSKAAGTWKSSRRKQRDSTSILHLVLLQNPEASTELPAKKSTSSRVTDQTVAAAATSHLPGIRVSLKFHSLSVPSSCLDFGCRKVNESIPSGLVIFLFLSMPLVITPPPTPPPTLKFLRQTVRPASWCFMRSQRGATHILLLRAGERQAKHCRKFDLSGSR